MTIMTIVNALSFSPVFDLNLRDACTSVPPPTASITTRPRIRLADAAVWRPSVCLSHDSTLGKQPAVCLSHVVQCLVAAAAAPGNDAGKNLASASRHFSRKNVAWLTYAASGIVVV